MNKISTLIIILFLWVYIYFIVNLFVHNTTYFNYQTIFDSFFPLIPIFIIPYLLVYPLILLPLLTIKEYNAFILGFLSILLITLPFFILLPGIMNRPEIAATNIFASILLLIYSIDLPHNLFPSTHVSLLMYSALIINKKGLYFILIIISLSTLFVKQHYFLDAIGGLIVGSIGYLIYLSSNQKNNSNN